MPKVDIDMNQDYGTGFSPVPTGFYNVIVEHCEVKTSTSGNDYLNCRLHILDGDYEGRKLFDTFNLWHKTSEKARNASMGMYKSMCEAMGITDSKTASETNNIINRKFNVKVVIESDDQYGDKNQIKGYYKYKDGMSSEVNGQEAPF